MSARSVEPHPIGMTPVDELATIARTYPTRDTHGTVTAFYVTAGGEQVARPFPTLDDAQLYVAGMTTVPGFFPIRITCGPVFTARGTIVKAPAEA